MKNSGYHGNLRVPTPPMPPLDKALFPGGGGGIAGGPLDSHEVICCFFGGDYTTQLYWDYDALQGRITYPTLGKGKSSTRKCLGKRIC